MLQEHSPAQDWQPTDLPRLDSDEFSQFYKENAAHYATLFPGAVGEKIPSAAAFIQGMERASEFHRNVALELAGVLLEYAQRGYMVNGNKLWMHQQALLFEYLTKHARRSFTGRELQTSMLEEAPGTGKTRLMGVMIQADTRMQVRGTLDGNILFLVKRRPLVAQQAMSVADRQEEILSLESVARRKNVQMHMQWIQARIGDVIPANVWTDLIKSMSKESVETAKRGLERSLADACVHQDVATKFETAQHFDAFLREAAGLLCGQQVPIYGPNHHSVEIIPTPNPEVQEAKKSDLLFGVPPQILRRTLVHTDTGNAKTLRESSLENDTPLLITSAFSFYQHQSRVAVKGFLSRVRKVYGDEAAGSDGHYQNIVTCQGVDGPIPPHVVVATAFGRDKFHFEHKFSRVSPEMGVNVCKVLRPQRWFMFPGEKAPLHQSGTYEAAEQLIAAYGEKFPLAEKLNIPKPTAGPHLMVVGAPLVPYVTMRLRQEYGHTGTQFLSYDANPNEDQSAILQLCMQSQSPTCLVASLQRVIDSFDWPTLSSSWLGVEVDKEQIQRFFGRQLHARVEHSTMIQQRFRGAPNHMLMHDFKPDLPRPYEEEACFAHVPMEIFLGETAVQAEQRVLSKSKKRLPAVSLPGWLGAASIETLHTLPENTRPPKITEQRESPLQFPNLNQNRSINEEYVRQFAVINGFPSKERDLWQAVSRVGDSPAKRLPILHTLGTHLSTSHGHGVHGHTGRNLSAGRTSNEQGYISSNVAIYRRRVELGLDLYTGKSLNNADTHCTEDDDSEGVE